MDFIPVNEPVLNGNEKKYLCECIDSGWISSEGPFVKEFEKKNMRFCWQKICNSVDKWKSGIGN